MRDTLHVRIVCTSSALVRNTVFAQASRVLAYQLFSGAFVFIWSADRY